MATLDESFFMVCFDGLMPSEKRYLQAMTELAPDPTGQATCGYLG